MDLGAHKQWILLGVGVLAGMTLVIAVVGVIVWARMRRKLRDLEAQAARPAGVRAPSPARAVPTARAVRSAPAAAVPVARAVASAPPPPAPVARTSAPAPAPAGAPAPVAPPRPAGPVTYESIKHEEMGRLRRWARNAVGTSVVIHVILLVAAGFIVALRSGVPKPDAVFHGDPPPRPRLQPRQLEMKVKVQNLQKASARPRLMPRMAAMAPSDIALPEVKQVRDQTQQKVQRDYATLGVSGFGSGVGGGDGLGFGGGSGGGLPNLMAARCSEVDRRRRLEASGGTPQCETAVVRGLDWLRAQQNTDGSWGKEFPPAMTGLALLAFMGHCETPSSPRYGPTVVRGMTYMKRLGRRGKGELVDIQESIHAVYQQGIAVYALAECYTMTRDAAIAPVLREAVTRIVEGQNGEGGWMYKYGGGVDSSVSAWQIQALKATHLTGLNIAGVDKALDRGVATMKSMSMGNGNWLYRKDGNAADHAAHLGRAGLGVISLQFWKEGKSEQAKRGLDGIMGVINQYDYNGPNGCMYSWYYHTLACYQGGGDYWKKWNAMMMPQLLANQAGDGSWNKPGGREFGGADATLMRSTLCILMLEAYYRYLPTTEG